MGFDNEFLYSSSSPSSSSQSQHSPCTPITPPNPNPSLDSSQPQPQLKPSPKRKAGRKKFHETRHPIYRGVRRRNGDKWVCEVREPNTKSRIWVGTYPTPEMAARAHDVAALVLRGTSATFNFPDSAFLLPIARSSSAIDIREAASKAVEAFKTTTNSTSSTLLSASSSSPNDNFCDKTTRCENMDTMEEKSHISMQLESTMESDVIESSCRDELEKRNNKECKTTLFLDEEALYNMPGFLDSMAEGLIITPPSMKRALDWDETGCEIMDLTLWND